MTCDRCGELVDVTVQVVSLFGVRWVCLVCAGYLVGDATRPRAENG